MKHLKFFPKIKINKKTIIIPIIAFLLFNLVLYFSLNIFINNKYSKKIYTYENVGEKQVGLVLGAGAANGYLSFIYKDRLRIAAKAYFEGKIKKIIISGDNGSNNYDEITPAKIFLHDLGVPENNIFLDYAGFDTYQSIYRANYIFKATYINIITQEFHLKRALYICDELGLNCDGIKADRQYYPFMKKYILRETLANIKAYYNTFLWNKKPKFLGEKIDLNLNSNYY